MLSRGAAHLELANFCYVRQPEALGLGHAVLCAQQLVGDEPFAVILRRRNHRCAGAWAGSIDSCLQETRGCRSLGVRKVPHQEVSRYGIVSLEPPGGRDFIEWRAWLKSPTRSTPRRNLAVIGRYVLPPEIFSILRKTPPGKNGEIQLTDALRELAKEVPNVCA